MVIVIDVRGMSKKKLYKVQDCFFKLGYREGRLRNHKPTHTFNQLMELAKMKKLSDLNSDELRTKLTKNNGKIVKYQLQNAEIIELLRSRALQPMPVGTLTTEDLNADEWWLDSCTEDDKKALLSMGVECQDDSTWGEDKEFGKTYFCTFADYNKAHRAHTLTKFKDKKEIHRVGSHFFWGAPECVK